jgi:hypothetical protein
MDNEKKNYTAQQWLDRAKEKTDKK